MANEYKIKELESWLDNISKANTTLSYIEEEYGSGIDYEDEDGELEFTKSDMDDLFHILCRLEAALKSEIKYEKES